MKRQGLSGALMINPAETDEIQRMIRSEVLCSVVQPQSDIAL